MKELPDFLKEDLIKFNERIEPGSKLTALRVGLLNYYETYNASTGSFLNYFQETPSKIKLSLSTGHSYLMNYYSSIIFFHLSFEQFIIEILESISPVLSRLVLRKELDLIAVLGGKIESIETTNRPNIDYSVALNRIEGLIKNRNVLPANYQIDTKYDFLAKGIETLRHLATLRNDIIHSGKETLNRYFYEYIFVNQILPLTREYLNTQKKYPLVERNLACNLNALDEIISHHLPEDYGTASEYESLKMQLKRINHFKELGRASYHNPIHMFEEVNSNESKKLIEETFNKKQREEGVLRAKLRQEILNHYKIYKCPCCGSKSLTTYMLDADCAICTYKINVNIGEPKQFGIMNESIFSYV
jgi:hypothetical protein